MRMMQKSCFLLLLVAGMVSVAPVSANHIESVIAVNYLTVEVEMDEELAPTELQWTLGQERIKTPFEFNEGVVMTGAPQLQPSDGVHDHVYRIPVNGMDTDIIYQISYGGQKPKTFRVYEGQEMDERYRNRYGSYF